MEKKPTLEDVFDALFGDAMKSMDNIEANHEGHNCSTCVANDFCSEREDVPLGEIDKSEFKYEGMTPMEQDFALSVVTTPAGKSIILALKAIEGTIEAANFINTIDKRPEKLDAYKILNATLADIVRLNKCGFGLTITKL